VQAIYSHGTLAFFSSSTHEVSDDYRCKQTFQPQILIELYFPIFSDYSENVYRFGLDGHRRQFRPWLDVQDWNKLQTATGTSSCCSPENFLRLFTRNLVKYDFIKIMYFQCISSIYF
jgi:hypothetical protein